MALLFLEEDPWLLEYDSCEKLYRDIMEQLTIRQNHPRASEMYSQLSANIRLRLKQFNNEVGQLNKKLNDITSKVTPDEIERRTRQVEFLLSKGIQMKRIFDDQVVSKLKEDRRQLVGQSEWSAEYNDLGMPSSSTQNIAEICANQRNMLNEQQQGLENLSKIISRQKDIANTIHTEVDYHNEILDDLGTQMDRTDQRVRDETHHIDIVTRKDKTCAYWVVIILLFISIIVVISLP